MKTLISTSAVRSGCHDLWNSSLVEGFAFTPETDMPICPHSSNEIPQRLIGYDEAKQLFNQSIHINSLFHENAYVHFYIDDYKFDGKNSSIWEYPDKAIQILSHYSGVISPDFSTYVDFPDPLKRINIYRMRAFSCALAKQRINVIQNVRWGTPETWSYCFDGIPQNDIVAIGTVASGLKRKENRILFDAGLEQMVRRLNPHTILIYGSSNLPSLNHLEEYGISIITFASKTNLAFHQRKEGCQDVKTQ